MTRGYTVRDKYHCITENPTRQLHACQPASFKVFLEIHTYYISNGANRLKITLNLSIIAEAYWIADSQRSAHSLVLATHIHLAVTIISQSIKQSSNQSIDQ